MTDKKIHAGWQMLLQRTDNLPFLGDLSAEERAQVLAAYSEMSSALNELLARVGVALIRPSLLTKHGGNQTAAVGEVVGEASGLLAAAGDALSRQVVTGKFADQIELHGEHHTTVREALGKYQLILEELYDSRATAAAEQQTAQILHGLFGKGPGPEVH